MIVPALDDMLTALSVEVEAFAVCQIAADSEISIPRLDKIEVHYVLAGTLHLMIEGNEALALEAGTIAVVPAGRRQRMAGSRNATRSLAPDQICSVRTDGLKLFTTDDGATAVRVMCGQMQADLSRSCSPFDGLSTPIVADLSNEPVVRACFTAMLCEAGRAAPCSRALTASLMKACLALLVRRHIEDERPSDLQGLFRKPWLAGAIAAVVERPGDRHSVSSLATISGRSRSTFSAEFTRQVGVPPMTFVVQTRLARAREFLAASELPIANIAEHVGFASRSHFSRVFRDAYGIDPSRYRRALGAGKDHHGR